VNISNFGGTDPKNKKLQIIKIPTYTQHDIICIPPGKNYKLSPFVLTPSIRHQILLNTTTAGDILALLPITTEAMVGLTKAARYMAINRD
jgi:hypothetical protein